MRVPLFGRLGALEWPVLIFSLILVVVEYLLSIITSLLPGFVISFFDTLTTAIFRLFPVSGTNTLTKDPELDEHVSQIANADGFVEICRLYGYEAEEHIVKTSDGYLLGIHRIGGGRNSNWRNKSAPDIPSDSLPRKSSSPSPPPAPPKPVVYLHHGLLMNSEVWVSNVDPKKTLPFVLADMGYDVWLGNNRGNKYSKKHVTHNPNSIAFWNFSIDDFALYDIPDTINYILYIVQQKDLVYIGFSQGSAQAFATLSINPELNKKVRLFIALAPAMAPPGLRNSVVDALMRASPSLIYLFFGRKAIMKSAAFWQSIMYPPFFVSTIDMAISSLFQWHCKNITYPQKLAAYPHLYSYTSVKSVVHWFQIIRSGRFHMYDDDVESPFLKGKHFYRVASFPTQNIKTPILLLYGKADSLVDIDVMTSELPKDTTTSIGFEGYEHLDMIWGNKVDKLIFPYIYSALQQVHHVPAPDTVGKTLSLPSDNHLVPKLILNLPQCTDSDLQQKLLSFPGSIASTTIADEYPYKKASLEGPGSSGSNFNSDLIVASSTPKGRKNSTLSTSSSSSSSSSATTDIHSMPYSQLVAKLSNSFSNTGINFGSSQPVVEVIRSDKPPRK